MSLRNYFTGKSGAKFWLNVVLAAALLVALPFGAFYALGFYTHHGEKILVPNVVNSDSYDAQRRMQARGLMPVVADSDYNERLKPGTVLAQSPRGGSEVKSGRIVYLTVNRNGMAPARIPDVIRNTTVRIAEQQLKQLGFRLTETEYVDEEPRDLVVGLRQGAVRIYNGDMVSRDRAVTVMAGAGFSSDSLDVDTIVTTTTSGGYDVLL